MKEKEEEENEEMKFNFEVWKVKLGLDLTNLSVPVTLSEEERNEFFGSLNEFIDNFWKPDESGPYPSCFLPLILMKIPQIMLCRLCRV